MKLAVIDLFCGAGGTTTGIERAKMFGKRIAKVIACVNHDPIAIKSHAENHKGVLHFTEDIRTLDLTDIIKLVVKYRKLGYKIAVWGSLECTNFSNAKGGQPRDADSRTLAEHLQRYIDAIQPDYVFIENVVEFMSWGKLDANGKPISRDKGRDYLKWIKSIQATGYKYDYAILNSADFGARTSRKRYFGVFAKGALPISFPEPTHTKNPNTQSNLFGTGLKKWQPVKDVLDLHDEGKSIFERDKELSEKTLARIYAGLLKYVAGGKDVFIQKYYSGRPKGKVTDVNSPLGTITTAGTQALVKANFLTQRNGGNPDSKIISVDSPSRTITSTGGNQDLITTNFLSKYHGTGENVLSVDDTCSTITTKDRLAKVCATQFIQRDFTTPSYHQSIEKPSGSITAVPKLNLVTAKPFLVNYNSSTSPCVDTKSPAPTITVARTHYIVNPSWVGNVNHINEPSPVIIARQDKSPLYLVTAVKGSVSHAVYEGDSQTMILIKEFMALYNIVDIKMRMLKVNELLKIQGFPEDYILLGNQQQQKKFIGNSVVPLVAKLLIESTVRGLIECNELKSAA